MQIIYAAPFILAAILGCLCCLAIPRWRPYAIYALVVPPSFAIGSVFGLFLIAIAVGNRGASTVVGTLLVIVYGISGIAGAWAGMTIVRKLTRKPIH